MGVVRSDSVALLHEVVGGFRLESFLGSGAMGVVFLASHRTLGRRVALKVLRAEHADNPSFVSRFFREAKVVSAIRHPNIVDVFDFVREGDPVRVAYVMEYVDGPTLSSLLKRGPLPVERALFAMKQLADALAAVHAVHVVHRDLKPSNILVVDPELSARPCVKITDFGICKISQPAASTDTATGMLLGTPSYMAPEQIVFEPVTAKTDVYALGEILYEMLAGERLFGRDVDEIFRRKLERTPLEVKLPEVEGRDEIRALIERCIAYRPEERPSAREAAEQIASIEAGLSTLHQRREPRPPKRSKRRIAFGVVSTGFIAGLIATLLILPLFSRRPPIVARSIQEAPAIVPAPPPIAPVTEVEAPVARWPEKPTPKKSLPFKRKELPRW